MRFIHWTKTNWLKKSINIDLDIFKLDIREGKEISIKPIKIDQETKRLEAATVYKTAKDARIAAKTTVTNNKTSGKAKLKAGEALTDDEISALFGD